MAKKATKRSKRKSTSAKKATTKRSAKKTSTARKAATKKVRSRKATAKTRSRKSTRSPGGKPRITYSGAGFSGKGGGSGSIRYQEYANVGGGRGLLGDVASIDLAGNEGTEND